MGDTVADQVYQVPPARFVAARDEAVAAARAAGDTAAAAALAKLRRPSVAAWLVNLLALRRPELLADLTDLAAGLEQAQRNLRGDQLRALAAQRRAVVAALVSAARSLAADAAPELAGAKLPLAEVEATLHAALSDRQVAERIRGGRLLKAVAYQGFGQLPRPQLRLVPGGAEAEPAEPDHDALAAELAGARSAAEAAGAEFARLTAEQQAAKRALAEIDAALAELTARRTAAVARVTELDAAGLDARRALTAARRRVGEVEAALAAAEEPVEGE